MTDRPNGRAAVSALKPGEVVFIPKGRFLVTGDPIQVESGEVRVMALPLDENTDKEIELRFSRPFAWVEIFGRVKGA